MFFWNYLNTCRTCCSWQWPSIASTTTCQVQYYAQQECKCGSRDQRSQQQPIVVRQPPCLLPSSQYAFKVFIVDTFKAQVCLHVPLWYVPHCLDIGRQITFHFEKVNMQAFVEFLMSKWICPKSFISNSLYFTESRV